MSMILGTENERYHEKDHIATRSRTEAHCGCVGGQHKGTYACAPYQEDRGKDCSKLAAIITVSSVQSQSLKRR